MLEIMLERTRLEDKSHVRNLVRKDESGKKVMLEVMLERTRLVDKSHVRNHVRKDEIGRQKSC